MAEPSVDLIDPDVSAATICGSYLWQLVRSAGSVWHIFGCTQCLNWDGQRDKEICSLSGRPRAWLKMYWGLLSLGSHGWQYNLPSWKWIRLSSFIMDARRFTLVNFYMMRAGKGRTNGTVSLRMLNRAPAGRYKHFCLHHCWEIKNSFFFHLSIILWEPRLIPPETTWRCVYFS